MFLVPGSPELVKLTNITDKKVHITWQPPISYTNINSYLIKALIIHTYANYIPNNPEWTYSNDTLSTTISVLPATKYNITLRAQTPDGPGAPFWQIIETDVGGKYFLCKIN